MSKLIMLFGLLFFVACNTTPSSNSTKTKVATGKTADTVGWSKDDDMEFLDGCVANSSHSLGDTQSFQLCKCLLEQVKKKYPALDSTAEAVLSDSARIADMARNCK
jgi:hypothetical protein